MEQILGLRLMLLLGDILKQDRPEEVSREPIVNRAESLANYEKALA